MVIFIYLFIFNTF